MAFLPDQAYDLIARAHGQERLAHAFLISGSNGNDLRTLAVRIAALVNGWRGVNTLDDLRSKGAIVIEPEGKIRQLKELREVLKLNAEAGYGDYRAPPLLQDDVADQYSFNNHALRRFNETVKDAIDPNGILSPGRGGIWPKAHRSRRGAVRK